ncbi:MAG: cytochrome P450, partial [Betaproteobacteria bacterium]
MRLVPARITPSPRPLQGLAFVAAFVRNPMQVVPRAAYEEDIVAHVLGGVPRYWVSSPELIRTVLLDEREKFQKRSQIRLLGPLLGKGILTSEGAHWKWQRQAAAPMFRREDLLGFVPAFVRASEALVARWRAMPANSVQAIERDMAAATFDVISATLLPSADDTLRPVVEHSIGVFQKSGGWGQLYAMANAPKWLPRPGIVPGMRAVATLRASVAAML